MNNHGKCLEPDTKNFDKVTQTDCESRNQDLLWRIMKIEGKPDGKPKQTRVCNRNGFCINSSGLFSGLYLTKASIGSQQKWDVNGVSNNQFVQGSNCLSIHGDSESIGKPAELA